MSLNVNLGFLELPSSTVLLKPGKGGNLALIGTPLVSGVVRGIIRRKDLLLNISSSVLNFLRPCASAAASKYQKIIVSFLF